MHKTNSLKLTISKSPEMVHLEINIQSLAYIWFHKGNQNEFLKHPKIKWLDGGHEPPASGLPVFCSNHLS